MSTSTTIIRVENNPQKIRESGLLQQYGYEIVTEEGETYLAPKQTDGSGTCWAVPVTLLLVEP
jgi:hypothetical protein